MRYVNIPKYSDSSNRKRSNRILKKYKPILFLTALVVAIALAMAIFSGTESVFRFVFPSLTPLENTDGKVNVLLLGNPGGVHDGAYLTDTIMVASYNLKSSQVYFISLPRDLWLDSYKAKLNAIYEIGLARKESLKFVKSVVGDILGLPIHYVIRVDFRGFVKAIDEVGGLDILVDRSFSDSLYPIEGKENDLCDLEEKEVEITDELAEKYQLKMGKQKVFMDFTGKIATQSADFPCRFERISFSGGLQHMSGEVALKYVRSRMGSNGEGSDFARSKRQQKVLEAFRKKALSLETLASPTKLKSLIDTLGISFETDIPIDDMIELYRLSKKNHQVANLVLGNLPFLINPPAQDYGGAFVVVPKDGNFNELHTFIKKVINGEVSLDEATASARTGNR
ncbi:LCP family protein [Candidatus Daviesbacteria bacterium]|nr:LCP family protein [Candidatus Daviesbacteria bacterium]